MLLPIKASKVCVCTEGRRSGYYEFYIFQQKAVILGLCDYSDKFPKMFCSSCGMECPSTANFCHQCGKLFNLSQVSNKAASSVHKEKVLKEYFHRRYPYAAIVSLLEKRLGVRVHVRILKRKLKIDLEN